MKEKQSSTQLRPVPHAWIQTTGFYRLAHTAMYRVKLSVQRYITYAAYKLILKLLNVHPFCPCTDWYRSSTHDVHVCLSWLVRYENIFLQLLVLTFIFRLDRAFPWCLMTRYYGYVTLRHVTSYLHVHELVSSSALPIFQHTSWNSTISNYKLSSFQT